MIERDKIFENTFDSPEFEVLPNFSFDVDPGWIDTRDEEDKMHYDSIANEIHQLILHSKFKMFNEIDEHGRSLKLKKIEINDVYGYLIEDLKKKYSRIDLFSEISRYFNIEPGKFYTSLSNAHKEELIEELDSRTGVLGRKNIKKLF
jgi:hypothetical protein